MALTRTDLKNIKELIFGVVDERFEALVRMIQNDVVAHMATKDDLAGVVARLDSVEARLGGIETRLDSVEPQVSSHSHRLDHIESHLADVAANQRKLIGILAAKRVLTNDEACTFSAG